MDILPFQQSSVAIEVARIGAEVFIGTELRGVDENGDHKPIASLPAVPHETEVPLVQKSHRRNEGDAAPVTALRLAPLSHLGDGFNDLHRKTGRWSMEYWNVGVFGPLLPYSIIPFSHSYRNECSSPGNFPSQTSEIKPLTAPVITSLISAYRLTNFGVKSSNKPSMSWITRT